LAGSVEGSGGLDTIYGEAWAAGHGALLWFNKTRQFVETHPYQCVRTQRRVEVLWLPAYGVPLNTYTGSGFSGLGQVLGSGDLDADTQGLGSCRDVRDWRSSAHETMKPTPALRRLSMFGCVRCGLCGRASLAPTQWGLIVERTAYRASIVVLLGLLVAFTALGWVGPLRSDHTCQLIRSSRHAIRIQIMYGFLSPLVVVAPWFSPASMDVLP